MGINHNTIEAARRRLLRAQAALKDYEQRLKSEPPDKKAFRRLYARVQVYTQEYMALIAMDLKQKYPARKAARSQGRLIKL